MSIRCSCHLIHLLYKPNRASQSESNKADNEPVAMLLRSIAIGSYMANSCGMLSTEGAGGNSDPADPSPH